MRCYKICKTYCADPKSIGNSAAQNRVVNARFQMCGHAPAEPLSAYGLTAGNKTFRVRLCNLSRCRVAWLTSRCLTRFQRVGRLSRAESVEVMSGWSRIQPAVPNARWARPRVAVFEFFRSNWLVFRVSLCSLLFPRSVHVISPPGTRC